MTLSPAAAPPAAKAVVEAAAVAATASKCPASPGGATAAAANKHASPTEAENSSWLVNTPERRPSYYGGVPFDVAQSAMAASSGGRRSSASSRGGGFGTSRSSGSLRGGNVGATSTSSSSTTKGRGGGGGRKRPKWEDSEPAPLSSLKKLLAGLEERCAEAGVSFGGAELESRSVFGSGTAASGRRPSWSLTSSSSSTSRRRRRTSSSSGGQSSGRSSGRSSIVRIGSIGDGSSTYSDPAGLLGSSSSVAGANSRGGGNAGDVDVGLVSANKKGAAKRTRGEGDGAVGAAAAPLDIPTVTGAGLMSPPSPSVTKSVLKSKRKF